VPEFQHEKSSVQLASIHRFKQRLPGWPRYVSCSSPKNTCSSEFFSPERRKLFYCIDGLISGGQS